MVDVYMIVCLSFGVLVVAILMIFMFFKPDMDQVPIGVGSKVTLLMVCGPDKHVKCGNATELVEEERVCVSGGGVAGSWGFSLSVAMATSWGV